MLQWRHSSGGGTRSAASQQDVIDAGFVDSGANGSGAGPGEGVVFRFSGSRRVRQMPAKETLRDRLIREFGVNLPIDDGSGEEAEPIVVTATDLQQAVDTQMQVLRWLGEARRVAWRLAGQEISALALKVVRADIETVTPHEHEVVSRKEAHYFVLQALSADDTTFSLPAPRGFVDPRSGLCLPCQLGWLHLSDATDNEPDSPGLGWSVAYDSLAVHGTVYVYDKGERQDTADVESARVVAEFRSAVADAFRVNPAAELKHQAIFKDSAGRGRCLLAILDLPGDSMSAVLLTTTNGCFVKARITFDATEREFGRMAHETMEAFVDAVRPHPAMTS